LARYLSEQTGANGSSHLTPAALEVLACIAFKQPISQAEIDRLLDADKSGLVVKRQNFLDERLDLACRRTTERGMRKVSLPDPYKRARYELH
jgi:hypothetical protein